MKFFRERYLGYKGSGFMIFSPNLSPTIYTSILGVLLLVIYMILRKKVKHNKVFIIFFLCYLIGILVLYSQGIYGSFIKADEIHAKKYSVNELKADLNELKKYILEENPLYFTDEEHLKSMFTHAYHSIQEDMTELEFYRLVNPIICQVNCGHTNLSISKALHTNRINNAKFFPLDVTIIEKEIYVLEGNEKLKICEGDQILSINGKKSEEIIKILIDNISGDGESETKQQYIISKHFNNKYYDFVDNSEHFEVELVNEKRGVYTINLDAKYKKEYNTTAWELHFTEYKNGNYYESNIYNDYGLLTINIFMKEKGNNFFKLINNFFSELQDKNIDKLIIDLRGNFGGNPNMARALLSYLISEGIEYFAGKLPFYYRIMGYQKPVQPSDVSFSGKTVLLTDGACFSTSGHFCSLFKYHNLGIIVGTTTAGTYVCSDSSKNKMLGNTRMRLHYSTLVYEVNVHGLPDNLGVTPDIVIESTIDDLLNKEDIAMKTAYNVLFDDKVQ